ncbi:PH domain-containing protein [uncultured Gilvimarinus sp.]|uniref:PH domain-containing protein n=1 Tax=uncultured Gilvimarinus sp. TaxID=1689143 RepID=UPI0030DDDEC4
MPQVDTVVTDDNLPPLLEEPWRPIDPTYCSVLRIVVLIYLLAITIPAVVFAWFTSPTTWPVVSGGLGVVYLLGLFLLLVWAPRRVKHTQYLLREQDVHVRVGFWWHSTTSAGNNRVQHTEVTQGPLERLYGLSKLVVYTAGGNQSDVKIPGLPTATAHRLKNYLTEQVVAEELLDAAE